jgi:hypothetical protein
MGGKGRNNAKQFKPFITALQKFVLGGGKPN